MTWGGVKLMFNFLVGPDKRHIACSLPQNSPETSPSPAVWRSDLAIFPWLFKFSSVLYLKLLAWETFSGQVLNALHALKLTFLPSYNKLGTDEDPPVEIVSVTLFSLRRWPLFFHFFVRGTQYNRIRKRANVARIWSLPAGRWQNMYWAALVSGA